MRTKPGMWRQWQDADFCDLEALSKQLEADLIAAHESITTALNKDDAAIVLMSRIEELKKWEQMAKHLYDAAVFVMAAMPEHIQGWQSQTEMQEAISEYESMTEPTNNPKICNSLTLQ